MPTITPHPTGVCPPGEELQINPQTMEEVCALPNSYPHYLADAKTWVMVPRNSILIVDPGTGKLTWATSGA